MTLKITNGRRPGEPYRVDYSEQRHMAWAYLDFLGNITCQSKNDGVMIEFPVTLLDDIKKQVAKLTPEPFDFDVYLRFRLPPKGGKSRNHATGEYEAGISAYELTWNPSEGLYQIAGNALRGAEYQYLFDDADAYIVIGKEVGIGSDGEPLLEDIKIICKAKFAKTGYKPLLLGKEVMR